MAATAGMQLGTLAAAFQHQMLNTRCHQACSLLQVRNYAARKGTREKARKKKVKVEVKKREFVAHNLRVTKEDMLPLGVVRRNDSWKPEPVDDVWLGKYHRHKVYSFAEAVEAHRETHHPTCYNSPNAFLNAFIELHMEGDKKGKAIGAFARTVLVPHLFDHGEVRTVMAFAKDPALLALADKAGATMSGDAQLVSKIQSGAVNMNDFHAVVAHPEIMPEVATVRGLMKKKFPNPRTETLGIDLPSMIKKILHGLKYQAIPHERQPLYGRITVPIGRLSMDVKELEENFIELIKDVDRVKPKRDGVFIYRTHLISPPSTETLKIDFNKYLTPQISEDDSYESDDDEEIERSNVIQ